ncbi:RNA polymerase sigma factor [Croceivirga thetidis]|uniref:Sigma-70 family RNA polymerase sigma factor n=1 Tax=Croceivirga thetidis TaxID=2721623 RepID=A0ABX1GMK8_9FLAO|nr:sigma-70 family RNA polymerase sigma factor [Croceivirga thetidis]NKI31162.1 sigma-70 family RNA polymerase sigma factor [Croceivirga thetidis]
MTELDFKKIYDDNYSKIMRLCMGYVGGDSDIAKDLTQEVFIKVWNNLSSFRQDSQVSTWIYRIAINTCLMNLRKKKPLELMERNLSNDESENSEEQFEKEKKFKKMYACIHKLGATNKAIILMELEGLPQKEIADVMGLNHEAIRTRIHRIKNQLSKCVTNERI